MYWTLNFFFSSVSSRSDDIIFIRENGSTDTLFTLVCWSDLRWSQNTVIVIYERFQFTWKLRSSTSFRERVAAWWIDSLQWPWLAPTDLLLINCVRLWYDVRTHTHTHTPPIRSPLFASDLCLGCRVCFCFFARIIFASAQLWRTAWLCTWIIANSCVYNRRIF